MIELLYSTGIDGREIGRVLKVGRTINTELGYLQCHFEGNQKCISVRSSQAQKAMNAYLRSGRDKLLKGTESDILCRICQERR